MKKSLSLLSWGSLLMSILPITNLNLNVKFDENVWSSTNDPFIKKLETFKDIKINKFYLDINKIMWICTNKGLYKTIDGISFEKFDIDINFNNILDIIVDRLNNYYFAANNQYSSETNSLKITVYKSTDGKNFKCVFKKEARSYKASLAEYYNYSGIILGTYNQMYVSGNKEENWRINHQLPLGHSINDILVDTHDNIFVATDKGLYTNVQCDSNQLTFTKWKPIFKIKLINNKIYFIGLENEYYVTDVIASRNKINLNKINFIGIKYPIDNMSFFNNEIWVLAKNVILRSIDVINFLQVSNFDSYGFWDLISFKNNIFIGGNYGLFKFNNSFDFFLDLNKPYFYIQKDNCFVFRAEQFININYEFLDSVTIDNKNITINSKDIMLNLKKQKLTIKLKEQFNGYALIFDNNNEFGIIIYNFWIKSEIEENDVIYSVNQADTDLLMGLVPNKGNTIGCKVIQTSKNIKNINSVHNSELNITINDTLIDFDQSYYVAGTVDESTNNFDETKTKQKVSAEFKINNDGIYKLFLIDKVGNTYESYLELGKENWKLKGGVSEQSLNELAEELKVTLNIYQPLQKQEAFTWLTQYKIKINDFFDEAVKKHGKGFAINITDIGKYQDFLAPVTYISNKTKTAILKAEMITALEAFVQKKISENEIIKIANKFNIIYSPIKNKDNLDKFLIGI